MSVGKTTTCINNKFLGCLGQLDGCLAEYIVMPCFTCSLVTGKLNSVQAALIEPLTIGVYTVNLAQIKSKSTSVGIFSAGPIGLSVLLKLLADKINNICMIEPLGYRLEKAREIGVKYLINPEKENVRKAVKEKKRIRGQ